MRTNGAVFSVTPEAEVARATSKKVWVTCVSDVFQIVVFTPARTQRWEVVAREYHVYREPKEKHP